MGGGGGGGYYEGGKGGGGGRFGGMENSGEGNDTPEKCTCSLIRVSTPLNSVQADLLRNLQEGECLQVANDNGRLVVLKDDGQRVGSLTPLEQAKIIACIEKDFVYKAKIVSKDGASCIVEVFCQGQC